MAQPIGISFIPSTQNTGQGSGGPAGTPSAPNTDLAQAYKILSLRLPTVVGAQAPVSQNLLTSPGAGGLSNLPGGMNPYAALFQALIKAGLGQGDPSMAGMGADVSARLPAPRITLPQDPGIRAGSGLPGALVPTAGSQIPDAGGIRQDIQGY